MRKYVVNILLFILIMITIDQVIGVVGWYLQTHAKGGITKRTNDLAMYSHHDILIMGSSRAAHHYDSPYMSDMLGMDVYNAGYDGNGIVLAVGLMNLVVERYRPKLVLFDVEPAFDIMVYNSDNKHVRYINQLKPYYKHEEVGKIIKDVSTEEWNKVHSGLIRYNSNMIMMLIDNLIFRDDNLKGFSPLGSNYIKKQHNRQDANVIENREVNVDTFKLIYIEKLIDIAKSNNIPLAFIASPKCGHTSSNIMKPVINICVKNNVPFIDYYADDEFMAHNDWFNDPNHLNTNGARIFSQRITNDLRVLLNKE